MLIKGWGVQIRNFTQWSTFPFFAEGNRSKKQNFWRVLNLVRDKRSKKLISNLKKIGGKRRHVRKSGTRSHALGFFVKRLARLMRREIIPRFESREK